MKFLKSLWQLLVSYLLDVHGFLDEKRVFGTLFLGTALLVPFILTPSATTLGSLVMVGSALLLGVPIGSALPIASEIKSLGLLDLVTNYSNKGDPGRLFGALFLVAALIYVLAPLVQPGVVPSDATLWMFEGTGLVLLFGSSIFDNPKAESSP